MKYRQIYIVLFFLIFAINAFATHIVGGVIYYEQISTSQYKLIFKVYRDCETGTAPFDGNTSGTGGPGGGNVSPFYFGIYEGNLTTNAIDPSSNRIIAFDINSVDSVRSTKVNNCLVPDGTCIQEAIYTKIITLPSNTAGYTIIHERCCRNQGILNIDNIPGSTDKPGITLRTYIPPSPYRNNSSAKFKSVPPVFICVDQTFYFDYSATDADGDQLRYFLVSPLAGLDKNKPSDEDQPLDKVIPIPYASPYSLSNIVGGTIPMTIDSITGLLYCKPNTIGRFVFSVMCEETRNGVVINNFAREIQVNVRQCNIPNADLPFKPGTLDLKNGIAEYPVNCKDFTVDFSNTSSNGSDVTYKWKFGDPASGPNNISTLKNASHTFLDSGTYIVTLYAFKTVSGELCVDSTRRIVKIYPGLKSSFTFNITDACQGAKINFIDKSTSTYGVINKWSWNFDNGNTSTNQNGQSTFNNPSTYNVKLIVSDTKECEDDTTISVTIFPKPNIALTNTIKCEKQESDLICNITVPSPYTILSTKWTLPGGVNLNGCNQKYTFNNPGNYIVNLTAITDKGCKDSVDFTINVNPKPIIVASNDMTICYDQKARINATGGVNYLWTPISLVDNSTSASPLASPIYPTTTKFIVKGTDANGCFNYDSLNISFFTKPFISAGLDTSVCLDPSPFKFRDNVQLNGQGSFSSVNWTPTAGLSNATILKPMCKPSVTTDYILNGLDANNCIVKDTVRVTILDPSIDLLTTKDTFVCFGDNILLNPKDQGAYGYSWNPTFWVSNPAIRNPIFTPLDTQLFVLTVVNYCYTKSDSIVINVNKLPIPTMPDVDSICFGQKYQFNVGNFITYRWANNSTLNRTNIQNPIATPTVTNIYYVTVTDIFNCKGNDSTKLLVHFPPSLSIVGLKPYICLGDTIKLYALTDLFATFKWSPNSYMSNDTARTIYLNTRDTTKYYLAATTISNCTTVDSFMINVQKPVTVNTKSPVHVCYGKYLDLESSGALYYTWITKYNINDTLVSNPQVYPDTTTRYYVKGSNDCFKDTGYVDVIVDTLPKVLIINDTSIYRGATLTLEAITAASDIEWKPKNLISTPYNSSIEVQPMDTTLFYAFATDRRGCVGYDSALVPVYGKNVLLVPTGFSPNGDGINDVFKIVKHLNIKKLNKFVVYDRWGNLVYETTDINKGWDGMYKDQPAASAVYTYLIEAINFDKETITRSGNITLIR